MNFPSAGTPPATIDAYIEDMLNELAQLADRRENVSLATLIRQASSAAARTNQKDAADRGHP